MTTYRERREERAEKLREWAAKRQARAAATRAQYEPFRGDWALATQPGRIPLREKMNAADARAFRDMDKAESMSSRADSIERQAAAAIYTDDPDAAEQLRAKIARLEAERQRWADYNAAVRKAKAATPEALAILDADQRANLDTIARVVAWQLGKYGQAPAYIGANLGGNIKRLRDRLALIERQQSGEIVGRYLTARYAGTCGKCGGAIEIGAPIIYARATHTAYHYGKCPTTEGA